MRKIGNFLDLSENNYNIKLKQVAISPGKYH